MLRFSPEPLAAAPFPEVWKQQEASGPARAPTLPLCQSPSGSPRRRRFSHFRTIPDRATVRHGRRRQWRKTPATLSPPQPQAPVQAPSRFSNCPHLPVEALRGKTPRPLPATAGVGEQAFRPRRPRTSPESHEETDVRNAKTTTPGICHPTAFVNPQPRHLPSRSICHPAASAGEPGNPTPMFNCPALTLARIPAIRITPSTRQSREASTSDLPNTIKKRKTIHDVFRFHTLSTTNYSEREQRTPNMPLIY